MKKGLLILILLVICGTTFAQYQIQTTDGRFVQCDTVVFKKYGVEYLLSSATDDFREYLPHTKIAQINFPNGDIEYISRSPNKSNKKKDPRDFTYLSPHHISLTVGASFPYLNYYSEYHVPNPENDQEEAGFGMNTNLEIGFYPDQMRGFGLGLIGGYNYNPIKSKGFLDYISAYVPTNAANLSCTVGDWHNGYLMGWLGYNFELGEWDYERTSRWMLEAQIMGGAYFVNHPTATANYDTNSVHTTSVFTSQQELLCLGAQGDLRYFLNRKFSLKASASIICAWGSFDGLTKSDYRDGKLIYQSVAAGAGDTFITWIGVNLGIAYTLGR